MNNFNWDISFKYTEFLYIFTVKFNLEYTYRFRLETQGWRIPRTNIFRIACVFILEVWRLLICSSLLIISIWFRICRVHSLNSRSLVIFLLCIVRSPCCGYLFFISCSRAKWIIYLFLTIRILSQILILISRIWPMFKHHLLFNLRICISISHRTILKLCWRILVLWLVYLWL